jgi:glucokinase
MGTRKVSPGDWEVLQVVHRLGAVAQLKLVNGSVQRLLASGWLTRAGQAAAGRGRPAILLAVNRFSGCFGGVDIAAEEMQTAVVAADGTLLDQATSRLGTDRTMPAVLDQIDLNVRGVLSRVDVGLDALLGLWAGVNGAVDDRGVVITCVSLGWHNQPLRDGLVERYRCGVLVQGAASGLNAAAEALMGAGRDAESLVYFHAGRGISARYVRRGQPLAGTTQRAGEFGHVVVEPGGPKCACGHCGCLEAVASGPAIVAALKTLPRRDLPEGLRKLLRKSGGDEVGSIVRAAFAYLDEPSGEAIRPLLLQVTRHLAMGAAMALAAYDPQVLILGGYLFENNGPLLNGVRDLLRSLVLDWDKRDLKVVQAEVMSQNRAVGGAAEMCQRFWATPRGVAIPA